MYKLLLIFTFLGTHATLPTPEINTSDGQESRKVLGSRVVTSVSVIMDGVNNTKTYFSDAVGKPVAKPATPTQLASPINLLNPDRYEFYTFDDSGDLVKRLMTLDEIQGIIASGDGEPTNYHSQSLNGDIPEQRVDDVINNVQNVLKEEIQAHNPNIKPEINGPDVTSTWNLILPAIFGTGQNLVPETVAVEETIINAKTKTELISAETTLAPSIVEPNKTSSTFKPKIEVNQTTLYDVNPSSTLKSTIDFKEATSFVDKTTTIFSTSNLAKDSIGTTLNRMETTTYPVNTTELKEAPVEVSSTHQPFIEPATTVYVDKNEVGPFTTTQSTIEPLKTIVYTDKNVLELSSTIQPAVEPNADKNVVEPFTPTQPTIEPLKTIVYTEKNVLELSSTIQPAVKPNADKNVVGPFTPTQPTIEPLKTTVYTEKNVLELSSTMQPAVEPKETTINVVKEPFSTLNFITELPTTLKFVTEPMETTEYVDPTTVKSVETTTTLPVDTSTSAPTTSQAPVITVSQEEVISNQQPFSTVTVDMTPTPTTLKLEVDTSTAITVSEESVKTTESTPIIINVVVEDEFKNVTSTELETTTVEDDTNSSEETISFEDFPVDELLNLLSSVGSSSTSTTSKLVTTETITPSFELTTENSVVTTNVMNEQKVTNTVPLDTTIAIQEQQTIEMDKNINEAVDSVISQMINQDISQTTIENLPTTYRTTESELLTISLTDVSEKNRYEEIDLENGEATSTMAYEAKTIQPLFEKATTTDYNLLLTSTKEVPGPIPAITTLEPKDFTTTASIISTPVKNLKTDIDSDYKFNRTQPQPTTEPVLTEQNQSRPEVFYITDFPLRVETIVTTAESLPLGTTEVSPLTTSDEYRPDAITESQLNTSTEKSEETTADAITQQSEVSTQPSKEAELNVTTESTTPEFVTVETVTSSPKLEKQPEPQIINRISSTTIKQDTTWALVSTVTPNKVILTTESTANSAVDLVPKPLQGFGLEDSTSSLEADVFQFTELCNELAFSFWSSVTSGISFARSVVVSPFATTSILAMVFLGARGATSGEMNDILKLDDMVTFNPHAVFKNVIESIEVSKKSGVAASVFVKELYSDKNKGKLLQFYKERVKQFYDGYVEEVSFKEINDIIRRRTNLLVKRQTWGKFSEYLKDNSLFVRPPLAAVTANVFQTDCSDGSTAGRDGELHFVVLPSIRQRKLIPIPAVVYRSGFLAGYEPGLDATAVSIGSKDHTISTIFVIPGQQGISAPGDGLVRLETRLIESAFKQNSWSRLLRSLIPRPGLEVQIPRFSHKSVINATAALQRMGLKDVFNSHTADLKGLNGIAHELYLSDIIQTNSFATCGEGRIDETHHSEIYPATTNRSFRRIRKIQNYHHDLSDEPRDYQRAFHDPLYDPTYLSLPLQFRPRQARLPDTPRLRFDRPFLYFVRHNPTGLILHMGRFNPRLLP